MNDVMEQIKTLSATLDEETTRFHPTGRLLLLGSYESVFLKAVKRKADLLGIDCDLTQYPCSPYKAVVVDRETVPSDIKLTAEVDIDHSYSQGMSSVSQATLALLLALDLVHAKDITIVGRGHAVQNLAKYLTLGNATVTVAHSKTKSLLQATMEGTGDDLVKSFYNGCLEYLTVPNEYLFYDVFPDARLVQTNADTKTVNLKSKSRFPTIMCRSIDARQVGLSEATNVLYLDDCVEGREEAKNRQRLDDKWEVISGDIMGRAIEGTPMVFTGTRYSLYDPIGRVQEHAQREGWAWRAIEIPALDLVTDESNYEYEREGKKVFTTAYFREQRELLSAEQFESEFQQQPFEAKGLLFNKDELNYFFELPPDREPDTIIAVGDTAESGSDSTSMPVAVIYGTEVYIVDVIFDDAPAEVTKPECAKCLISNKVASATFEANNAGQYYARDVDQIIRDRGYSVGIRTKRTISNKQTRIEFASDNIKKNFYFKHPSTYKRGSQYWNFMKEVTTYTRSGKVPHDDAPDSLSLLENEIRMLSGGKVEVFKRPY